MFDLKTIAFFSMKLIKFVRLSATFHDQACSNNFELCYEIGGRVSNIRGSFLGHWRINVAVYIINMLHGELEMLGERSITCRKMSDGSNIKSQPKSLLEVSSNGHT